MRWLVPAVLALAGLACARADRSRSPRTPLPHLAFESALYNLSIPENSGPKARATAPPDAALAGVPLPAAGAKVRFRIRHGDKDKLFKAEERTVGEYCFLTVRTRANNAAVLNRERKDLYRLDVRATATLTDGETLEADTVVVVTVTDVNDLSPLFYPTEYETTVREDAPAHMSVVRVQAEDADLGLNGEIYYSLLEPNDQFDVHPTTGVISPLRPLKAERPRHELVVLARDRASLLARRQDAPAARARVLIHVTPANLHAPELRARKLPELIENSTAEIYAIVEVTDRDEGDHGRIASVEIVDGDPDGHFRVRPSLQAHEWDVVAHALLDREAAPTGYNLTLRARDMGRPARASYLILPVTLTDANDNAPVFSRRVYEAKVPETAPPGSPVLRLKVSDRDVGRNARVYLEIVGGNEGGEFTINADTGVLYTAVGLDAEHKAMYTLTVSAIDQGNAGARHQSSAKVKVQVVDANDNDPVFTTDALDVAVAENAAAGQLVARVVARDADSGENAYISYSLANVQPVPFEVDHFSGAVRTTRLLDYESMRREWALRVRASDWGLPYRRQAELALTVRVTDVNDNRPQFERVDCVGYVPRRTPPGHPLATLSAIDLDAGDVVSYRIAGGNDDSCFSLDSATGVLTLVCDLLSHHDDTRILNVTATDGTHFADATPLTLHLVSGQTNGVSSLECRDTGAAKRLTELLAEAERANAPVDADEFPLAPTRYGDNLHSPEFINFPVVVKVNESVSLGSTLVKLKARDRDLGYNGLLVFALSGGDPDSAFRIDPDTGALEIIGYLDREREAEYYLNISVYDLGTPQRSVSRLLPITVLDVNDNAPKFERSLASKRVTENALNGTVIFHANATDRDSGVFAAITYTLSGADGEFCVGRESGVVTVCAPLDRERRALYELAVRATDGGGRWGEARVRVAVDDVNDVAPRYPLPAYSARVREDVPPGALVALVAASDPDEGAGGTLIYSLPEQPDDVAFTIDRLSGALRTNKWLDYEERQVYGVTVRCTDGGQPALWTDVSVIVEVVDVDENAHAPLFADGGVLTARVAEDAPAGTRVLQAAAVDADPPGRDSRLLYYIVGGSGMAYFTIDDTGVIRTTLPLDRERKPHYWLTVAAEDQGVVPRYSTARVHVEVTDVNDAAPWPQRALYSAAVTEHAPAGTRVAVVHAVDGDDSPEPANITYSIVAGNPDGLFSIDEYTGAIVTTGRTLDRESLSTHALEVRCWDGALSAAARVHVVVLDLNDRAPVFAQRFYDIRVPVTATGQEIHDLPQADAGEGESSTEWEGEEEEDSARAVWDAIDDVTGYTYLATVVALDGDAGVNGTVRYSARARGVARGVLRVHAATGRLYAARALKLRLKDTYEITVRACDGGRPPLCGVARAAVRGVEPGGGRAPTLTPPPPLQVAELDAPGFLLAVLQANDPDHDTLYYDIVGGDESHSFSMGREDGSLVLARPLLWEERPHYALNVTVTDGLHVVTTIVNITVINDANEGGVWFSREQYAVRVVATARVGQPLAALTAMGAPRLLYGIQDVRETRTAGMFRVHETTGVLELARPLDRQSAGTHEVTVWARDTAPRSSRALCRVTVTVEGGDQSAPVWPRRLLEVRLPRNAPPGALVAALRAADPDPGDAGRIVYSLVGGDAAGLFDIDPMLGDVRLTATLPPSGPREYTLSARAANAAWPARAATLPLHVTVIEPDDAPPRFVQTSLSVSVGENEPAGAWLTTLETRGGGGGVRYMLRGGEGALTLNPAAGTLLTAAPLDYERQDMYNLTVTALTMSGGEATASVTVHVLDRNEYPPRLSAATYSGVVSEGAPVGTLVTNTRGQPLVLATIDGDSPAHRQRAFEVVDPHAAARFTVDPTTGALKTIVKLDYEEAKEHIFTVKVHDMGTPRLVSESDARVTVRVRDVNDVAPAFTHATHAATLLLPTARGVHVASVQAHDPDLPPHGRLVYDIIEGDPSNVFTITANGTIVVSKPDALSESYSLRVRASDGELATTARVRVTTARAPSAGLVFARTEYRAAAAENTTRPVTIVVLDVLGAALNEHVHYSILNPVDEFEIGATSGAVRTTGVPLDRETRDSYTLLVQARSLPSPAPHDDEGRVAHARLHVAVTDVNDNCPVFVERPYVAAVLAGAEPGADVIRVRAVDADAGDNGEVRYEMKRGHGELFRVDRRSGHVTLRQTPDAHTPLYTLVIAAYDGGVPACGVEAMVSVRVWDGGAAPAWSRAHYSLHAREDAPPGTPLHAPLHAVSPLGRQLIYSLVATDDLSKNLFDIHFDTAPDRSNSPCVLIALGPLDYERTPTHEFTIRATDGVTGAHADASVSLALTDVNDCAPVLEQDMYRGNVSEAAAVGDLVLTVHATDNDTGVNGEIDYSLSVGAGGDNASLAVFTVNAAGAVRVAGALDAETSAQHHLLLTATDRGRPALAATAHLFITVLDVNDNAPAMERGVVAAAVSWEAAAGVAIARVAAWDPDATDQVLMAIQDGVGERSAFSIDPSTGVVSLRESAGLRVAGPGAGARSLNVSASDGAHATWARVKITPVPVNRHAPRFPHLLHEARVMENQPPPVLLTTVKAYDEDLGEYGAITYSIPSTKLRETFAIDPASGALTTRAPLDRESRAEWDVVVAAADGGGLRRHTTVRVRVGDLNDNAPTFALREYRASVSHLHAPLAPFVTLVARDADGSEHARITYSVYEGGVHSDVSGLFHVDANTGALSFARNATQYAGRSVQVWVRARDAGGLAGEAPVAVYVMAAGERPPRVTPPPSDLFLSEDAEPGTLIAELRSESPDSQPLKFRLAPALWPRDLFAIDDRGRLTLSGRLDRETAQEHTIGIIAECAGAESPAPSVLLITRLHALDANDHAPALHAQPYVLHVAENTRLDTNLIQLMADDPDAGSNGEVRYALGEAGEEAGPFAVDAHSGWVVLRAPLDRETRAEHRVPVRASDGGVPPRVTRGTLVVRVIDYNDCPHVFTQQLYTAEVSEDAPAGTVVTRLAVEDADTARSALTYLVAGGDARARFTLRAGGELVVARPLDRETQPHYSLTVAATDGKYTAYATVNVTVLDVNDNPPYCVRHRYFARLSEDAAAGTAVATVLTADADGPGEPPAFTLTGEMHQHFNINEDTGVVTVSGALDRESRAMYAMRVHARDRQRPAWACSSELIVHVTDVNDNAPVFTTAVYAATLPEDADIGTLVAKVHATDADLGENRLVRYSWVDGGGDMFALDTASGIVTLRATLDRETQAEHRLLILATDGGTPSRSATATVRLSVADVNDNPPEFEFREYRASLSELVNVGAKVLQVAATSKDSGVNAEVRYALVAGDERGDFIMDDVTGLLTVAKPLDYERRKEYYLSVQAVDRGTPPLSDMATVIVTIIDANDNAPTFPQVNYGARVREDSPVGTKVIQLIADDADSDINGRVTYSINRGDPTGHFAIDPDTGYISVASLLDRETIAAYVLEICARDRGLPTLESSATVNVEVLDANDNAPQFEGGNYTAVVREDRPLGHVVLTVAVTDADAAPNGAPFTYDLQAGNEAGAFRIEQDGTLRTAARFSHRIRERYLLQVRVFDNGAPPLYADAWVSVRVVEESQYPPVATPLDIVVNSYRDEFPGGVVGRVFASDRDPYDTLTYALAPSLGSELFHVDADGTIRAAPRLDAGEYRLNATVSDGKFTGHALVRVSVVIVDEELLQQTAVVRFRAVTASEFILSHRKGFIRAVAEGVERPPSDVVLVSVQPSDLVVDDQDNMTRRKRQVAQDLDVAFGVRAGGGGWLLLETLRRRLHAHLERLEESARLVVEELVRASCAEPCVHGACKEHVQLSTGAARVVASDVFALVAPPHRVVATCHCQPTHAGARCDTPRDQCASVASDGSTCCGAACGRVVSLGGDGYLVYRVERGVVAGARLLDDEIELQLRFKTRRARGTLLSAQGHFDFATLELVDGELQFTMELGAGTVSVRAGSQLHDAAWHEVKLTRRGGAVRLTADKRTTTATAPPPNAVLDARADRVLVGATLQRHAHALAPEQVTYGFEGCISELKLGGAVLPLEEGGTSSDGRAQLVRAVRARTGSTCAPLGVPGPCAAYPCLNGGTCRELTLGALLETSEEGFVCECHARFTGARCAVDSDPCATQPCLHGGRCVHDITGYRCECPAGLSGGRCERGRWCAEDACAHGGECEEGEWGPSCRCRGYFGARCEWDVDECAGEPCLNGATCVNEPGSFRCVCPPDRTGMTCGNPLDSIAVTAGTYSHLAHAWRWAVDARWPLAAAVGIFLAVLLAIVLPLALRARKRPPPSKPAPLNSQQRTKLSNLEADRRERPPSCAVEPPQPLNNMDTLRSYGSAGDELDALPSHYIRNLNVDVTDRKPWSEQMHLHTFVDNKIYNDLKGMKSRVRTTPPLPRRIAAPAAPGTEPHIMGGYHWDCSDWCTPSGTLPGISEVAGSERRDSSSPPNSPRLAPSLGRNEPRLSPPPAFASDKMESDSVDDRDTEPSRFTDASSYLLHPDEYLPRAASDSESHSLRGRRIREPDTTSLITMLEERNSLLGGGGGSCSDVSARLCEIEDSDEECDEDGTSGSTIGCDGDRTSLSAPVTGSRHTAV